MEGLEDEAKGFFEIRVAGFGVRVKGCGGGDLELGPTRRGKLAVYAGGSGGGNGFLHGHVKNTGGCVPASGFFAEVKGFEEVVFTGFESGVEGRINCHIITFLAKSDCKETSS